MKRLLTIALLALASNALADNCDRVCVDAVKTDNGVSLLLVNETPWPVTASLAAHGTNVVSEQGQSVTRVLGGDTRQRAIELVRRDPKEPYDYHYGFKWTFGRMDAKPDASVLYRLPYEAGSRYTVLQGFHGRFSHEGRDSYAVDFRMPVGTPVVAARGGVVVDVEQSHDKGGWDERFYDTANYIVILHPDGTTGEYYHLKQHGAAVHVGQRVKAGEMIGWSGNTGHTTMPHLHFAVYRADAWGRTQSVPFRFITDEGVVDSPRQWHAYGVAASSFE